MNDTNNNADHFTESGERIPFPLEKLERLAAFYDDHDTSDEMEQGLEWEDPRPMVSTSLRLPRELKESLKEIAKKNGDRYTSLVRKILESAVEDSNSTTKTSTSNDVEKRLSSLEKKLDIIIEGMGDTGSFQASRINELSRELRQVPHSTRNPNPLLTSAGRADPDFHERIREAADSMAIAGALENFPLSRRDGRTCNAGDNSTISDNEESREDSSRSRC